MSQNFTVTLEDSLSESENVFCAFGGHTMVQAEVNDKEVICMTQTVMESISGYQSLVVYMKDEAKVSSHSVEVQVFSLDHFQISAMRPSRLVLDQGEIEITMQLNRPLPETSFTIECPNEPGYVSSPEVDG